MAHTIVVDIIDRSVPPLSPVNIAVINQPNPAESVSVDGDQMLQLIAISKYYITDSATGKPITGSNIYDYFPELNPGGGGGGGDAYTKAQTDTLLEAKVDKLEGYGLSEEDYTAAEKTKLAELDNITVDASMSDSSENPVQNKVITNAMADKVDVVSGKGLSTEDFTTAEKNKLSGIADNANNYSLPTASSNTLGGVKVGTGLSIDGSGVLSATVDSELDTTSENPVQNKVIAGVLGDINTVLEGVL